MIDEILHLLKTQPLIAGGAGMAVVGWAMMQAKTLPLKLWRTIQDQFSTTITIYSEDSVFRYLDLWLSRHPSAKHSRRFGIASWHNRDTGEDDFALTPGVGLHLLREGWRFYFVNRQVEAKEGSDDYSRRRRQTISLTTMGRSARPLHELLGQIKHVHDDKETVPVYIWTGFEFRLIERRVKRPMDTVYVNPEILGSLVGDLDTFLNRRPWYARLGIPYRRGYLLEGPPGTGKTTLIFALASYFGRAVYIINPSAIENDNALQNAVNCAGANFVVVEDVDALQAAEAREKGKRTQRTNAKVSESGITTSGLLNAIDGIGSRDGRVLFITSNHPDVLDPALIRPGRIDRRVHMGAIGMQEARAMMRKFFPDQDCSKLEAEIAPLLPLPAAELQNRLLSRMERVVELEAAA